MKRRNFCLHLWRCRVWKSIFMLNLMIQISVHTDALKIILVCSLEKEQVNSGYAMTIGKLI